MENTTEPKIDAQLQLKTETQKQIQDLHVPTKPQWLEGIAVFGAVLVMVMGVFLVFRRLKELNQGFGPNSLKALGVVIFLPVLMLLALLTDFKTETLAALLGTVAGYVLSNTEDKAKQQTAKPKKQENKSKPEQ